MMMIKIIIILSFCDWNGWCNWRLIVIGSFCNWTATDGVAAKFSRLHDCQSVRLRLDGRAIGRLCNWKALQLAGLAIGWFCNWIGWCNWRLIVIGRFCNWTATVGGRGEI